MSQQSSNPKALASLFVGVFFTGISGIFIKYSSAPGAITAFYRMLVALIVLLPLVIYKFSKGDFSINRKGVILALLAGVFFGMDMVFWATGVVVSNATLPTIMGNLAPLWVGFIALIFLKEKLNWMFWIGVILSSLGVLLMVHKNLSNANNILTGILLGGGAGVFYAIFYVVTQKGRNKIGTIPFLFFSTLGSTLLLLIANIIMANPFTNYSADTYILFFVYGAGVQAIGWMFINFAQGHFKATFVSTVLLGQPLVTAIIAVLLLNEVLTIWHYTGAAVVIAGIYIVQRAREK